MAVSSNKRGLKGTDITEIGVILRREDHRVYLPVSGILTDMDFEFMIIWEPCALGVLLNVVLAHPTRHIIGILYVYLIHTPSYICIIPSYI